MNALSIIQSIENTLLKLINELIKNGYDIPIMKHGISITLRNNILLWISTHKEFYASWSYNRIPYALYIHVNDKGERSWLINTKNELTPVSVHQTPKTTPLLNKLESEYRSLVDIHRLMVNHNHGLLETHIPSTPDINTISNPTNSLANEWLEELAVAKYNLSITCMKYIEHYISLGNVTINSDVNDWDIACDSHWGMVRCSSKWGTFMFQPRMSETYLVEDTTYSPYEDVVFPLRNTYQHLRTELATFETLVSDMLEAVTKLVKVSTTYHEYITIHEFLSNVDK